MVPLTCQFLQQSSRSPFEIASSIMPTREELETFSNLKNCKSAIQPSSYLPLLQACTKERSLGGGLQLHAHMIKRGLESNQLLLANLLNLYIKSESLDFARRVFDTSDLRTNIISWNSMISMYCRCNLVQEALFMFLDMLEHGLDPDQYTFSTVIGVCGRQRDLSLGRQLYSLVIKLGCEREEFVASSLMQMYASCRRIDDATLVFDRITPKTSPCIWNSMIATLVENGSHVDALNAYHQMQDTGIKPTPLTFSSLLKACAALEASNAGEQIHAQALVRGFTPNLILESALLDFYLKYGKLEDGRQAFARMESRSVITWNSILRGYSRMGQIEEALKLFQTMRREGFVPDKFTFPALLIGVTVEIYPHEQLRALHGHIIKVGLESDEFSGSSLISMYSAMQNINDAWLAFRNVGSMDIGVWSAMISACVKHGKGEEALRLFTEMLCLDVQPSQFIYSSLFTACSELSTLDTGKQIHAHSLKSKNSSDVATKNSLLTMYSNCGLLGEARKIFDLTENRNVISFNSMISALAQHGSSQEAAELFEKMKLIGLKPDEITVLNLLSAFNHAGLIDEGMDLFKSMEKEHRTEPTYQHYACIVDMLARAGKITEAIRFIYEQMPFEADPPLWRMMLGACGKHRDMANGSRVGELLLELEPDEAINHVLLANVYARVGSWAEADRVRCLMTVRGLEKEVGVSWIQIKRRTHTFRAEDRSHPLTDQIYRNLRQLIEEIKAAGYMPDISFTVHNMEEGRREEALYYHSEKLAFALGDLCTAEGVTLRIMKNLRVCGDCHSAFRYFSLITRREIILKDNCRFHHFTGGVCSCGDYW